MAFDGTRSIDWAAHNSARNYPLVVSADGVSTGGQFTIPQSMFNSLYVYLPWDRDIDPSRFFIRQIRHLADRLGVTVSYKLPGGVVLDVATASVEQAGFGTMKVLNLDPEPGWDDVAGAVVIDEMPAEVNTPIGVFDFEFEQTQVEVDCVRPAARSMNGIIVNSGDDQSTVATGLIDIRAGENMRIRSEQVGDQYTIYLDAIDGSNLDDECECGDQVTDPIRTINLVAPDEAGNIDLTGDKCLEVNGGFHTILLTNPCADPCCDCEELDVVAERLKPLGEQVRQTRTFADKLELEVIKIRDRLNYGPRGETTTTTTAAPVGTTTTTTAAPTTTTTTAGV